MDKRAISNLCYSEEDSDMKLKFENPGLCDSLTFPVHSLVLKRTSNFFKTMLNSENRFREHETGVIEISVTGDVSVGLYFVKYLYTKTLPELENDLYVMLMKLGHMYQVTGLHEACEKILSSIVHMGPFSVCKIFQSVEAIASSNFRQRCIDVMLHSAFLIFMHNRHLTLHERTMKLLLQSDTLNVLNEEQALEGLWQWGLVRCIQENKPGNVSPAGNIVNLLPYIRWRDIPAKVLDSRWIQLAREKNRFPESSARSNYLNSTTKPEIRLNPFATQIMFDYYSEKSQLLLKKEGTYNLVLFTSNVDVILSGFTFVIGLRGTTSWKDSVQFLFNKMEINDRLWSSVSQRTYYQVKRPKTDQVQIYKVEVELLKPVVAKKAVFNILDMCVTDKRGVAFSCFDLKSDTFRLASDNPDQVLNVDKKVASLNSLLCFVKL